jgi:chromosome segregation ATPase
MTGGASLPEVLARLEKLAAVIVSVEREVTDLHAAAKQIQVDGPGAGVPSLGDAPFRELEKETETLRASSKKLQEENERLEGELQSLRLYREQTQSKIKKAVAEVVDLKLDPASEQAVRAIVVDRDRLQEEKQKLESDMARIKNEVTKRLSALKGEIEKEKKDHQTVRVQKDNLMRQLMARDEEAAGKREVTLEDITSSETFRTMLANIRKTSRQEITILHEAVASVRAIDPRAYETVLEIIARAFKKAQVENPLATLPRD